MKQLLRKELDQKDQKLTLYLVLENDIGVMRWERSGIHIRSTVVVDDRAAADLRAFPRPNRTPI